MGPVSDAGFQRHGVVSCRRAADGDLGDGVVDADIDALTLRQTGRMQQIPILMYGTDYWKRVIDFQFLADEGVIQDSHLDLFQYTETPQETWEVIKDFHGVEE